jgi:hypothetical protein
MVSYLNLIGVALVPNKTDPPLAINPNAVLTFSVMT